MLLPKDIFVATTEYVRFLLYLYSEKVFTVEQLSSEFNISKWVLYKQVRYWEGQDYVSIIAMVGRKGGKQYHYQATDKLEHQLKDILVLLLKARGVKEFDIRKIIEKK